MSRELDLKIARDFFGYTVNHRKPSKNPNASVFAKVESFYVEELGAGWEDNLYGNLPAYSTKIEDALKIIPKLSSLFCCLDINYDIPGRVWTVTLTRIDDEEHKPVIKVFDKQSLPEAICLAALESLKHGKKTKAKKSKRV